MALTESLDPSTITFEDLERDPFPFLAWMRANSPVAQWGADDEWLVTSWDDCVGIAAVDALQAGHPSDDLFFGAPNVLRVEGDEHKALRAGIDSQLRPRAVKSYIDPVARPIVVDYIERLKSTGAADLTTELFELISVRVVGDLLGLPDVDDATLVRWFHSLSEGLGGGADADPRRAAADRSLAEIDVYMRDKVATLRSAPDHSIISHMLHGGIAPGAEPRTFEDVMPSIRVIILGGFQEPGHAIANTIFGLLSHQDQLEDVLADPRRFVPLALQEGLRWISPIGLVARQAREEFEYKGHVIPAGARVQLAVCSANRDESRYDRPTEFDLRRMMHPNATFGYGEHYCAGHFLARELGQIAIEETLSRLPGLRLDPNADAEISGYVFRGVKRLPAVWDVADDSRRTAPTRE